jgi:aspartate kinase
MSLIVLKFGGTSVATPENRSHAFHHISRELNSGNQVVVVVSAMGRKGAPYATDTLISLLNNQGDSSIKDLLVSCGETISACVFADGLNISGIPALAFNASTARLRTEGLFGSSNIIGMDPTLILQALEGKFVPVITGFQGLNEDGWITTIGRGGSDTSAVAIGNFIGADIVDIYTDVPGIAKADPRIVPEATFLDSIPSDDLLQLAFWGSGIIHPRAVSSFISSNLQSLRIRSTFLESEGTKVLNTTERPPFSGLAVLKNLTEDSAGKYTLKSKCFKQEPEGQYAIITAITENLHCADLGDLLNSEKVETSYIENRMLQILT